MEKIVEGSSDFSFKEHWMYRRFFPQKHIEDDFKVRSRGGCE
jgi:hypothetical protein